MRLWYHPESDSLFLDKVQNDPLCEDVTDDPAFRKAARERGLRFTYDGADEVTSKRRTIADAIVDSYKKWERKPADLYPTPVDGTESVIPALQVIAEYAKLSRPLGRGGDQTKGARVWEPACGDGRMARVLEYHGFDVLATDIRETPGHGIGGIDFLKDAPRVMGWSPEDDIDLIVSNPPFSLAEQFIRKALSITPNVAMLLKMQYWNAASRLPFFAEHRPAFVLPLTWRLAFLEKERGKSPLMDCAWVIWSGHADPEVCVFEPLKRRRYPGYAGPGLKSSMAALEEALGDLTNGLAAGSLGSLVGGGR